MTSQVPFGNDKSDVLFFCINGRSTALPLVIAEGKLRCHTGSHDGTSHMTSQVPFGNDKSDVYKTCQLILLAETRSTNKLIINVIMNSKHPSANSA